MALEPRTAPRERLISYRLSLLLAMTLVVAGSGALIIVSTTVSMRASQISLARRVFSESARRAMVQSRSRARLAIPAIEALANHFLARQGLAGDRAAIADELLDTLRANGTFVRVSWSDAHGTFESATRATQGGVLLNESTVEDGRSPLDEYTVDGAGHRALARHVDDSHYDPRTRPYFTAAARKKARAWTEPRILAETSAAGVTCAKPVYATDGALLGVLTVDFDLGELSAFLGRRHVSAHSRLFVFRVSGEMIAASRVRVTRDGPSGPSIATTATIDDPLIREYGVQAAAKGVHPVKPGDDEDLRFDFAYQGEPWLAAYDPFDVDDGAEWVVGVAAPESDFLGELERSERRAFVISAVTLAVALTGAAFFATRMSRRLSALADEMVRVGTFRLEGAGAVGGKSVLREMTMMQHALDAMEQGLRSFARFVPADLVRAVLESGQEARLGGRLRPMTAFFSDIAGFTSVAEELPPGELVALLGDYLEGMTAVIAAGQGTVDKFIGDGIMAFWGAPTELLDHAARACEAAVRCQRALEDLQANGSPAMKRLATRIGLATGEVLVGNIGTPERMNYTVMGDVVNLASRLEGLNKQYGTRIMASEATVAAAAGRVVARAIDVVVVKGKARGVKVFELTALLADHDARAEEIAGLSGEALDAYLARDFGRAEERWERVIEKAPGDHAATLMRDRARRYATEPPPADWSGVHVAHEK